jgi:lipopolysaccharide/colanic/teichoic acid biosynthesis glycosyltransferase
VRRAARLLLYLGTAVVVLGFGKVHARYVGHYDYTGSFRFAWSFAYIALLCLAAYGVGLPDLVRNARSSVVSALGAAGAAALGISLLELAGGTALLPRFVVFGAALALVPWYALCSALSSGGRARAEERDRVAVVADLDEVETLRADLALAPERHAQLVATLLPEEAQSPDAFRKPLLEAVISGRATVVVLDRRAQADESVVAQAASLHEAGVRVRTLSLFYEEWLGKLPLTELERVSLMFDVGELHRLRYGRVKRLFDVVLAGVGCVALAVVTPLVLVGNLVANRGALFYRQERVGRAGRRFMIRKFRTMTTTSDVVPTTEWTTEGDPRITPFGRLLRRTHLDELPQVLNILVGDLSVVGPRPEQPRYVAELVTKIPFYDLRHLARPGLTGWAQVKYGYAGNESDALEKLQYEFFYLRHQGLAMDVRVVGRTIRSVVARGGR